MRLKSVARATILRARFSVEGLEDRAVPSSALPIAAEVATSVSEQSLARGFVYTTRAEAPQTLEIDLPSGRPPVGGWPVVLAIHGGGWRKFDAEEYARKVAPALVHAGFAVVAPNYVLARPGAPSWPLALDDLQDAVSWVGATSSEFGWNSGELAVMGQSAGGHLAAMLGTEPVSSGTTTPKVRAVVDFYGPADLGAMVAEKAQGAPEVEEFLGGAPTQIPATYIAASPVDRVTPNSAPILIVQGTADTIVPAEQSEELAEAYAAAGVLHQLIMIRGATHGFGLHVGTGNLVSAVVGFLRQELSAP